MGRAMTSNNARISIVSKINIIYILFISLAPWFAPNALPFVTSMGTCTITSCGTVTPTRPMFHRKMQSFMIIDQSMSTFLVVYREYMNQILGIDS